MIGAGIVDSLVGHLARLGWTDIVQLDKGPLPNPGGSTGHASNFIYLVDHSREMTALTLDSVQQYKELDVFTESGGTEVARTEERMEELRRRMASAKAWGVEPVSLVTPAEIKELVPFIDESILIGGFYTPGARGRGLAARGHADARAGTGTCALTVVPNTEVTDIETESGRVKSVTTTDGDVEAETVVIACGVWSPKIARMAGATIPLTPAIHQMIDIGPVPRFAGAKKGIEWPIGATWIRTCTSARTAPAWRSARTRTARSCTTPRRSPRSRSRRCRRPSSPSPRTTSRSRWSRRSS